MAVVKTWSWVLPRYCFRDFVCEGLRKYGLLTYLRQDEKEMIFPEHVRNFLDSLEIKRYFRHR